MSSTIDERVVDMVFNNGDFEKGIKESMKSLDDLKKALELDKSAKSLDSLEKAVNSMDFSGLEKNVQALTDRFSTMGIVGITALQNITNRAITAAEQLARSLTIDQVYAGKSKYEQKTEAVQAILAATGKDIEEVEAMLGRLNEYTDWTSFNFAEMTKTIGMFVSSGVDMDIAEIAMEGIGNAAADAGASIQNANVAMYNFAQAISTGHMSLNDWRSIEKTAHMGTEKFKKVVIDTAIELGVLQKVDEHVGQTTKGTIVDFQNFSSTLKEGWMNNAVMIKSLAEFADRESEIGSAAFDAAKVTISFSQAMASIKDAVSTGWMNTFQLIFGNFYEASEFFTNLTEMVIENLEGVYSWRNGVLEAWRSLGGREYLLEGFLNILQTIFDICHGISDAMFSIFPDTLAQDLAIMSQNFYNFSVRFQELFGVVERTMSLVGQTGIQITPQIEGATRAVKDLSNEFSIFKRSISYGEISDEVKKMQEYLIEAGYSLDQHGADGIYGPETQDALTKFQKASGLIADGIFGPKTKAALQSTVEGLRGVNEETGETETTITYLSGGLERIQRIAAGVFSVFHIGWTVLKAGLSLIGKVVDLLAPVGMVVIDLLANFGDLLVYVDHFLTGTDILGSWLNLLLAYMAPLAGYVFDAAMAVYNFFASIDYKGLAVSILEGVTTGVMLVGAAFSYLASLLSTAVPIIKDWIGIAWEAVSGWAEYLWEAFSNTSIGQKITAVFEALFGSSYKKEGLTFFQKVIKSLQDFQQSINDFSAKAPEYVAQLAENLTNSWNKIHDYFANFGPNIKALFKSIWKAISEGIFYNPGTSNGWAEEFIIRILQFRDSLFDKIKAAFGIDKVSVANIVAKVGEWLKAIWDGVIAAIKEFFGLGGNEKDNRFSGRIELADAGMMSDIAKVIMTDDGDSLADRVHNWLVEKFKMVVEKINSAFAWLRDAIWGLIPDSWKNAMAAVQTALTEGLVWDAPPEMSWIVPWLEKLVSVHNFIEEKVKPIISSVIDFLSKGLAPLFDAIMTFIDPTKSKQWQPNEIAHDSKGNPIYTLEQRLAGFTWIWDKIKEWVGNFKKNLVTKIQEFQKWFTFDNVMKWLDERLEGIVNVITSVWKSIVKVFTKLASGLLSGTSELARLYPSAVKFFTTLGKVLLVWASFRMVRNFSNIFNSLRRSWQPLSKTVLDLSESIALVAGALWLIGTKVKPKDLNRAGKAILITITELLLMAFALSRLRNNEAKSFSKAGKTILSLAGSLAIISGAIAVLGLIPSGVLIKGGITVTLIAAALIGIIAAVVAINQTLNKNGTDLSGLGRMEKGLLYVAGAIAILSAVMIGLGSYLKDWNRVGTLAKGFGAVSVIALLILGIIAALTAMNSKLEEAGMGRVYKTISKQLWAVSGSIAVLAGVALVIGKMSGDEFWHGAAAVTGIAALVVAMIWALNRINNSAAEAGTGMWSKLGSLAMVGAAVGSIIILADKIMELCNNYDADELMYASVLIGAIGASIVVIGALATLLGTTFNQQGIWIGAEAIVVIATAIGLAMEILGSIALSLIDRAGQVLWELGGALTMYNNDLANVDFGESGKLYQSINFIKEFASVFTGGFALTSSTVNLISDFGFNLWKMGWQLGRYFANIPTDTDGKNKGVKEAVDTALALAEELGNIGGVGKAFAAATALAEIGAGIKLYYGEVKDVTVNEEANKATENIRTIFEKIAQTMPEDADIQAVAEFAEGSGTEKAQNLTQFGLGITALSSAMEQYGAMSDNLDKDKLALAGNLLDHLYTLKTKLETANEFWVNVNGNKSNFEKFSEDIGSLGAAISDYATFIGGIGVTGWGKIILSGQILDSFAALKDKLSNIKAIINVLGVYEKGQDLDRFAYNISQLGHGLYYYSTWVHGIQDIDGTKASVGILQELANVNNSVPGGLTILWGAFKEDSSGIANFAAQLPNLGEGLAGFAKNIGSQTFGTNVLTAVSIVGDLASIYDLAEFWAAPNANLGFGENLERFARHIVSFTQLLNGIDPATGESLGYENTNFAAFTVVAEQIEKIIAAEQKVKSLGLSDTLSTISGDIREFYTDITTGIDITTGNSVLNSITGLIDSIGEYIVNKTGELKLHGVTIVSEMSKGMTMCITEVMPAHVTRIITEIQNAISERHKILSNAGGNMIYGFAEGILAAEKVATAAAVYVVSKVVNAVLDYLGIHSPSRVFANIGMYADKGLALGLNQYSYVAEEAGEAVAQSAIDSVHDVLKDMSDIVMDDIDVNPVISPVLDMSGVRSGAKGINGMFLNGADISLRGGRIAHDLAMSPTYIGQDNSDVVRSINALNARVELLAMAMTHLQVVTDTGTLVGVIAPGIDQYLGQEVSFRGRRS